jgi:hypothetical protein
MLRRQWPLIVLLALLGSYAAFGVALVAWPSEEKMYGSGPKLHAPGSADERAAAGVAIAHLRAHHHRTGALKAIDASVHGDTAGIAVSAGGVISFTLRRSGGAWRVVEHHAIGYA